MSTVKIEHLTKKFNKTTAIDDLSLEIEKGKITGLIGADGAGKTTLIRLIIGLLLPNQGKVSVLGLDPFTQKEDLNKKIGYMPQRFGLYEDLSVIENLELYADLKNVPYDFENLLEFTNLKKFQKRLAGNLSGGMKQKLGLACVLLGSPEFLLLDEPSVGVDPISRRDLLNMVKALISPNTTVLWSTAYLDEAHSFDTSIVLNQGKVIYNGKPYDLASTSEEFEAKIIELMGGYHETRSKVAESYIPKTSDIEYRVVADNLEKLYGDFYAVKNNSFQIRKGEIFGLLGPNGAGKSTSFKMMCGLLKPTNGTARIMGIDITKDPEQARSNLGYMAQKFSLYESLTVKQNLDFFAEIYGIHDRNLKKRVDEIIDIFGFSQIQKQKSGDLPLGFKQKLSLACALIHTPPILFLDEPTSGVDAITRKEFWNHITSLAKKGVTVLVTTHFMDEAEYCDRISLFFKGEAVAIGTPDELKNKVQAKNMEEAFLKLILEGEK